jgi:hypothetical protein
MHNRTTQITSCSRILEKFTAKKFPCFYETEGSFIVHDKPTLDPTLSQINPVHKLPPYFCNILLNTDLPTYTLVSKVARNTCNIYLNPTTTKWVPKRNS